MIATANATSDWVERKESIVMIPFCATRSAPTMPARKALSANDVIFARATLTPRAATARSLCRMPSQDPPTGRRPRSHSTTIAASTSPQVM